jgi:hypothetical protein
VFPCVLAVIDRDELRDVSVRQYLVSLFDNANSRQLIPQDFVSEYGIALSELGCWNCPATVPDNYKFQQASIIARYSLTLGL